MNSADITRFVECEVQRLITKRILLDGKVSKKLKERILETLINGAQGMFRWVEMSLEALSCIKYAPDFEEALGRLPKKLSGLYDIIYKQIDQTETHGRHVAIEALTWLLCAQRLLSAEELLAAVHAVDAGASSDSDEDDVSGETGFAENDVLRLCRNLVVIDSEQRTFRFAHQSVREYLLGKSEYTITRQHALATERCIDVYLTEPSAGPRVSRSMQQNDILRHYAGAYWPVHYTYVGDCDFPETHEKVSRFLMEGTRTSHYYIHWASSIRSEDDASGFPGLNQALGVDLTDRLHFKLCAAISTPETHRSVACAFGFSRFLKDPALSTMEVNQRQKFGECEFTFLVFAVEFGYDQIVQLLLDQGADINAKSGYFGNALGTAIARGDDKLVQILFDRGADINTQSDYRSALWATSFAENEKVMQILLDKEVDIEVRRDNYGTIIRNYGTIMKAASSGGYDKVVQMLFDKGVDIDIKDYGYALRMASGEGDQKVVQMLLDKRVDIDAQDYDIALLKASERDREKVVLMLLDRGADVNAQGGELGNALQVASYIGYKKMVQVLLNRGADINAQGGYFGNALQAASSGGHDKIVQILLDEGADINAQGGQSGNALQAASYKGYDKMVQVLLNRGADVNAQGGQFGNAL